MSNNGQSLRIFHGPANVGGIGRYLADDQRARGARADFIVYRDSTPHYNHHQNLHLEQYGPLRRLWKQIRFFLACLREYDVFHFYYGHTLLPLWLDLPILKLFGKKMIMTYCGSDIRLPSVERRRNPYADLLAQNNRHPLVEVAKRWRMRWQGFWCDRLTAPRSLYAFARESIPKRKLADKRFNINNPLDIEALQEGSCRPENTPPTIIHAPSNPGVKGTGYVEKTIEALRSAGHAFHYRRLHQISNVEAIRIMKQEADIIVDQLLVGGIGTLAYEAMAMGKPVCVYLLDEYLEWYPDCPAVNCTIETLEEKLAWLITHPEERVRIGEEGLRFARTHVAREKVFDETWQMVREICGL